MNESDFFDYVKNHNEDHSSIIVRLQAAENNIEIVKNSNKNIYKKMDEFMKSQSAGFANFTRWLIGTILITWILGTCAQLGIVMNLKDKINDLNIRILMSKDTNGTTEIYK